jgi:hypothetical protein
MIECDDTYTCIVFKKHATAEVTFERGGIDIAAQSSSFSETRKAVSFQLEFHRVDKISKVLIYMPFSIQFVYFVRLFLFLRWTFLRLFGSNRVFLCFLDGGFATISNEHFRRRRPTATANLFDLLHHRH